MSAPRKHPDIKFLQEVSVDFIKEFQKDGYLTKRGGSIKTWKKRWCVLKDNMLYYFPAPHESTCKGALELDITSEATMGAHFAKPESKKAYFTVKSKYSTKYLYTLSQNESQSWCLAISQNVANIRIAHQQLSHEIIPAYYSQPRSPSPEAQSSSKPAQPAPMLYSPVPRTPTPSSEATAQPKTSENVYAPCPAKGDELE